TRRSSDLRRSRSTSLRRGYSARGCARPSRPRERASTGQAPGKRVRATTVLVWVGAHGQARLRQREADVSTRSVRPVSGMRHERSQRAWRSRAVASVALKGILEMSGHIVTCGLLTLTLIACSGADDDGVGGDNGSGTGGVDGVGGQVGTGGGFATGGAATGGTFSTG